MEGLSEVRFLKLKTENYFSHPDGGDRGGATLRGNDSHTVIFKSEAFGDPAFSKPRKLLKHLYLNCKLL